jgi:hypothetical protein
MDGGRAVGSPLRLPVTLLPVEASWSVPRVAAVAPSEGRPPTVGVAVTTNYDVDGVRFRTADPGLMPVVSPAGPVDLEAGEPQMVAVELCPGYAPTTYFLSIVPRAGTLPLRRLLPMMIRVEAPPNLAAASVRCGEPKDEAAHDLFNCVHFGTHAAAQRFLGKYPHDPSRLDADHDRIACEHLR